MSEAEPIAVAPPIQPTGNVVATELPQELIPAQRGWGFFAFVACAIVMIFIAAQRQDGPDEPPVAVAHEAGARRPSSRPSLPPLTSSVAGAVERPRDALSSIGDNESFAADAQLAATNPALLSPAVPRRIDRSSAVKRGRRLR